MVREKVWLEPNLFQTPSNYPKKAYNIQNTAKA